MAQQEAARQVIPAGPFALQSCGRNAMKSGGDSLMLENWCWGKHPKVTRETDVGGVGRANDRWTEALKCSETKHVFSKVK
ncbi:hypothetical protein PQR67_02150 [Paraburkholderia fungorum]|uniref:hypothetical protein n=1 Tax=Paraburkholderia fungorum TaxID=134537 RepID=UPI0038B9E0EC